jgi:hypothetical protein
MKMDLLGRDTVDFAFGDGDAVEDSGGLGFYPVGKTAVGDEATNVGEGPAVSGGVVVVSVGVVRVVVVMLMVVLMFMFMLVFMAMTVSVSVSVLMVVARIVRVTNLIVVCMRVVVAMSAIAQVNIKFHARDGALETASRMEMVPAQFQFIQLVL